MFAIFIVLELGGSHRQYKSSVGRLIAAVLFLAPIASFAWSASEQIVRPIGDARLILLGTGLTGSNVLDINDLLRQEGLVSFVLIALGLLGASGGGFFGVWASLQASCRVNTAADVVPDTHAENELAAASELAGSSIAMLTLLTPFVSRCPFILVVIIFCASISSISNRQKYSTRQMMPAPRATLQMTAKVAIICTLLITSLMAFIVSLSGVRSASLQLGASVNNKTTEVLSMADWTSLPEISWVKDHSVLRHYMGANVPASPSIAGTVALQLAARGRQGINPSSDSSRYLTGACYRSGRPPRVYGQLRQIDKQCRADRWLLIQR